MFLHVYMYIHVYVWLHVQVCVRVFNLLLHARGARACMLEKLESCCSLLVRRRPRRGTTDPFGKVLVAAAPFG